MRVPAGATVRAEAAGAASCRSPQPASASSATVIHAADADLPNTYSPRADADLRHVDINGIRRDEESLDNHHLRRRLRSSTRKSADHHRTRARNGTYELADESPSGHAKLIPFGVLHDRPPVPTDGMPGHNRGAKGPEPVDACWVGIDEVEMHPVLRSLALGNLFEVP